MVNIPPGYLEDVIKAYDKLLTDADRYSQS